MSKRGPKKNKCYGCNGKGYISSPSWQIDKNGKGNVTCIYCRGTGTYKRKDMIKEN